MESDSGSEDIDIALFSKKFKLSQKKLREVKKKTKKTKDKVKGKELDSKSSNRAQDRFDNLEGDKASRLGENINNPALKIKDKSVKRKHKVTAELDSESVAVPLKKTKYKDVVDNVVEEGQSLKRRKKAEKLCKDSAVEPSVEFPKPKREKNKLGETVGTSSEESELETDSFRSKTFKDNVETVVKQKDVTKREKVIKPVINKNNAEVGLGHSDNSEQDLVTSPSDSESDTDQDSDAEAFERNSGKISILNKDKDESKMKGIQKDATYKKSKQNIKEALVKTSTRKPDKTESEPDSSSSDSETSDGEDTDNASLESDSDNDKYNSESTSTEAVNAEKKDLPYRMREDLGKKKGSTEGKDGLLEDETLDNAEEDKDPYAAIKKELANIPLEDLVKIKDKLGLKVFSQIMQGGKKDDTQQKRIFKRENKNRPMEMSSKRPVPIVRQTNVPKKKVARDPRFDDLSGEFKEEYFERNYSFLQDVKAKEREVIKKKLKKSKNEEKKQKLKYLLNRMNQQEQAAQQKQRRKDLEMTLKQKEKQLVKEGKNPYFLKKAERRKLELAEKYKELQKSGKVDQYLSRKRQKNAHKEKKKLPVKHARSSS